MLGDLSAFSDREDVAEYAREPMAWAIEQGLFKSMVGDNILPDMPVSRIQLVHALMGILALDGDMLAEEIFTALPEKTEVESLSRASHEEIQSQVEAIAQKHRAAGLQVAVVEGGQLADTYSYGWAVKNEVEMTEDHKIRCASISKVMVGMSAMLLQEDGIVSLDASIGDYWGITAQNPYYKDYPVTIASMLTHTSSIINAGDETFRAYESVKSKLQGSGYSKLVPGSSGSWGYNNYAFGVLGMTVLLGFLLSHRKRIYWIAAGICLVIGVGHIYALYDYAAPASLVSDLTNYVRVLQMPLTAMCLITFLRENPKCYETMKYGIVVISGA